ncbi:MAG: DUF1844 domain-containing protein [Terriglobia bacterium]
MANNKDEPSSFRVVDRRPFSSNGTRREPSHEAEKPPEKAPEPAPVAPVQAEAEPEEYVDENTMGFDMLVSYLSTTAMFQLGLLEGPGGERIPPDLPNARRTIDLLQVLQEKTHGNLTQREVKLLDDVLYDLRLSFVEIEKRLAPRPR